MSPKTPELAKLDPQQRYSINEAVAYLRSSRKTVYQLIKRGELRAIVVGMQKRKTRDGKCFAGRTYIPGSEIARLSC